MSEKYICPECKYYYVTADFRKICKHKSHPPNYDEFTRWGNTEEGNSVVVKCKYFTLLKDLKG